MTFKLKGIEIQISFTFFALIIFLFATVRNEDILKTLLFSLFHEFGHLLALFILGEKNTVMKISFFGGEIQRTQSYKTNYLKECFVHLSGPILNIVLALFFLALKKEAYFFANASIAAFNLLPIDNLDGGRALFAIISIFKSEYLARKALFVISLLICIPLTLFSFVLLLYNSGNLQLTIVLIYILLLIILKK